MKGYSKFRQRKIPNRKESATVFIHLQMTWIQRNPAAGGFLAATAWDWWRSLYSGLSLLYQRLWKRCAEEKSVLFPDRIDGRPSAVDLTGQGRVGRISRNSS